MSIGLGKVPSKTTVEISVANIRVLPEITTALNNPLITLGEGSTMQITGRIQSESYVWYKGGDKVGVYDLNWNKIADLSVGKQTFTAHKGPLHIRVESKDSNPEPWLECQFFVKDATMTVHASERSRK
jgi:hypothetical protein